MTAEELVARLDRLNTLKWKSLKGTPDESKHCGLGISDKEWQTVRVEVLGEVKANYVQLDEDQTLPKGLTARLNLPDSYNYVFNKEALDKANYAKIRKREKC